MRSGWPAELALKGLVHRRGRFIRNYVGEKVCYKILWCCPMHIHELIFVWKYVFLMWKSVCFSPNGPGVFCNWFCCEIRWLISYTGASPIAENHNTYFKCVSIFSSKLCQILKVRDAFRVWLFLYHNVIKMKCLFFISKLTLAYNFVPVRI